MLEDFKMNVKIKLVVLWTSVMFRYIYKDNCELYVPKIRKNYGDKEP